MVKIFIGGFPLGMSELELAQLISLHGTVLTLQIARDKVTDVCKGFAFIGMKNQADADNVIETLNGRFMNGRELSVRLHIEQVKIVAKPVQTKTASPIYKKLERVESDNTVKRKRLRKQA